MPQEKEAEITPVSQGQSPFETKIPSAGPERYLGEFLELKDLVATQSASKTMHALFKPAVDPIKLKRLLAAVFMGEEALVVNIVQANRALLFERGTYRMPLLNADSTISEESEQVYYDVTPFQLSLYSGDFQMWGLLLQLIPDELKALARDEVRLLSRGGPDLVKMNQDPRTVPLNELQQLSTGPVGDFEVPGNYDLLCNPDGIIYFDHQFFYANQETQDVTLLAPNVLPADASAFDRLRDSLEQDMVMNSSRRTSDVEHALIQRTLDHALERNGIHYRLSNVHYHDTYDSGTRLINAYRKYRAILAEHPEGPWDMMKDHWMNIIGKAQRFAPLSIIQRFSKINRPPYPSLGPDREFTKKRVMYRTTEFPNVVVDPMYRYSELFPLTHEAGLGFDFGLYHRNWSYNEISSGWVCGEPYLRGDASWIINMLLQIVDIRKECQIELMQALEHKGPSCCVIS